MLLATFLLSARLPACLSACLPCAGPGSLTLSKGFLQNLVPLMTAASEDKYDPVRVHSGPVYQMLLRSDRLANARDRSSGLGALMGALALHRPGTLPACTAVPADTTLLKLPPLGGPCRPRLRRLLTTMEPTTSRASGSAAWVRQEGRTAGRG